MMSNHAFSHQVIKLGEFYTGQMPVKAL